MLKLTSLTFHRDAVVASRPDRSDVGTHAATRDDIHLDSVFLKHLDDADVREASSATRGKGQTHSSMPNFASKPANVGVKVTIRPAAQTLGSNSFRTAMDKTLQFISQALQEVIQALLALLPTCDGPQIEIVRLRKVPDLSQ